MSKKQDKKNNKISIAIFSIFFSLFNSFGYFFEKKTFLTISDIIQGSINAIVIGIITYWVLKELNRKLWIKRVVLRI